MKYYVLEYHGEPKGYSGERCKSTYDLSEACKNCGTGARLVNSLITKGISAIKKPFFMTLSGDFLVSEELYKFLLSKDIRINKLQKVTDSKKNKLPFYHLYTEIDFPKSLPTSKGLITERQCSVCKKNGYYCDAIIGDPLNGIPTILAHLRLIYRGLNKEFLASSELFNSWEHLGVSNLKDEGANIVRYARSMLIVSERIKWNFEGFGVGNAGFEEIIIN